MYTFCINYNPKQFTLHLRHAYFNQFVLMH